MKSRILDISDCAESPLLAGSKCRRRHGRRSATDLFHVRRGFYTHQRDVSSVSGLTEDWFKGADTISDHEKTKREALKPSAGFEAANISYQARCAERWWAEFCRWFGDEKA